MDRTARSSDRRSRLAVWGAGLLAALFVTGTLLAPVLSESGAPAGSLLRLAYAPLCHQQVERSLPVGQGVQAVCARCGGLYLGGLVGLLLGGWLALSAHRRPHPLWLALLVAPTLVDALFGWTGLPALANVPRMLVSLPAGCMAGLFLAVGVSDLFAPRSARLPNPSIFSLEEADG